MINRTGRVGVKIAFSVLFGLVPEKAQESGKDCFEELFDEIEGVFYSTIVDRNNPSFAKHMFII